MAVDRDTLLSARVRLPEHVVHRTFVAETVVLNLKTGMYHGLNPMGGHMLDILNEAPSVRDAATLLVKEYPDQVTIEADLVAFCSDLLDRELVEIVVDEAA
jgi:hypothetical protein